MPNSTKKCLTKSEISKMGPDYYMIEVLYGRVFVLGTYQRGGGH